MSISVPVKEETRDRINALKVKGQSYDGMVSTALDDYEKAHTTPVEKMAEVKPTIELTDQEKAECKGDETCERIKLLDKVARMKAEAVPNA